MKTPKKSKNNENKIKNSNNSNSMPNNEDANSINAEDEKYTIFIKNILNEHKNV